MKNKFFFKRVAVYLIMMLIPMTVLFLAFGIMDMRVIEKDLRQQGRQTVNGVAVNFDLVLSNVLYQNDLLTSTTRMNLSLKRILKPDQMTYGDAVNISSLRAILSSIKDSHEYIESIYLYADGADRFFSSGKGIHEISDSEDTAWITVYEQMDAQSDTYIASREIMQGTAGALPVLSVYKRLLLQPGCIVVNINMDRLEDILGKQLSNRAETIYLVNQEGKVLARKADARAQSPQEFYFADMQAEYGSDWSEELKKYNGKWVSMQGGRFLLSIGHYEEMDMYFVSAISSVIRTESIFAMMKSFLVFLAIDLCVVVVLAYITTKRSFDQISYMLKVFNEAEKGLPVKKPENSNRDEYDVIMNNIIYLFLNTNHLNNQLKENEYKREHAEMMALQLQINPHFLFNTLQTVDMQVREGKTDREDISTVIRQVSDILKYALGDPGEPVTIEEEIEYLKKYAAIQKFRFGEQFIVYYEVEEDIRQAKVFRLFLQPLVENSLLHGIRRLSRKGYIKVSIQAKGKKLRCCVVDTGVGMSRQELSALNEHICSENAKGIGLVNLYRRLCLSYGEESSLHICSKEGMGTAISFYIPFEEK